jgi:cell division protein FtsB
VKRLPLLLAGVAALVALGVLSSIVTQGFQDLGQAKRERQQLRQEKRDLEKRIDELDETLEAVRTSDAAVESMARRELGWVRPGERVILIATPTPPRRDVSPTAPTPTPILTLPQ